MTSKPLKSFDDTLCRSLGCKDPGREQTYEGLDCGLLCDTCFEARLKRLRDYIFECHEKHLTKYRHKLLGYKLRFFAEVIICSFMYGRGSWILYNRTSLFHMIVSVLCVANIALLIHYIKNHFYKMVAGLSVLENLTTEEVATPSYYRGTYL